MKEQVIFRFRLGGPKVTIPGYTAELSLSPMMVQYRSSVATLAQGREIAPQLRDDVMRDFWETLTAGSGYGLSGGASGTASGGVGGTVTGGALRMISEELDSCYKMCDRQYDRDRDQCKVNYRGQRARK